MRRSAAHAVILLLVGCAPSVTTPTPVVPTRPPEECRTLVEQVRAHPDSFRGSGPEATQLVFPPNVLLRRGDGPMELVVRMLVDESGAVVRDSIRFEPSADRISDPFALKGAVARYRFRPSVLDGCAVPAWTKMSFRFGG
jgi:hypothetical protein